MRRSLLSRLLTAVLALWLVLELGEPGIVHLAAMGAGAPMTAMSHAGMTHEMGPGMSMDMDHGDHDRGGGQDRAPEQTKCPCVAGGCVSATAIALVDATPAITFGDVLVRAPSVERVTASLLPRPGPRYSRPYTTGPPRV